jgi:predicted permease
MKIAAWLRTWGAAAFRRARVEQDMEEELRTHIDRRAKDLERTGVSLADARRRARIEFGSYEKFQEECRETLGTHFVESLVQDARFGLRVLRKSPGFTAVAVLTLGLGIGANTAIFSVVNAVLLRPLPYPKANRLAIIWSSWGKEVRGPASGPELVYFRQRNRSFEEVAGIWVTSAAITGTAEPEQVRLGLVTANFLPLLVEKPQLGRLFGPGDDRGGSPPMMLLTDGLWRRQFGANPAIVGSTVRFDGGNFTVVGVLPRDFKLLFPEGSSVPPDVQVFVPFLRELEKQNRDQGYIRMIGRLRSGISLAQAQSEADSIAAQLRGEFKDFGEQDLHLSVLSLQSDDVRGVRPALVSLFAAVGLVLLIACANLANLLLARASTRRRETVMRAALGAAKSRIVRQLMTESILLGCLGGAAALGVGWAALKWMVALQPEGISRLLTIRLDGRVLLFTLALSVGTAILFGLAPALAGARGNLLEALKQGTRSAGSGKGYFRQVLVGTEVGLGCMLLVGTGLMVRTFSSVLRADPGFRSENVLTFRLAFPGSRFRTVESTTNFLKELRGKLAAMPGTQLVGGVSHLPLDESLPNWYSYYWPENAPIEQQNTVMADHRSTLPGYFSSVGAKLIAGREFEETDDAAHTHVAIVDDTLAEETWPGQNAVGKKLVVEDSPAGVYQFVRDSVLVIGVVRHIQSHSLTSRERGQIYLPWPLAPRPQLSLVVRTTAPMQTFAPYVQHEVRKLDKEMPVSALAAEGNYVEKARAQTRFVTVLAGTLAGIALALACVGVYGVTSYSVAQRTSEIAIRRVLGAHFADVRGLVLRQSALPVASGLLGGLLVAAVLTPLLSGLLYGVRPEDPWTFGEIAAFLGAAGLTACYIPARRATKLDPMAALRSE